MTQNFYDIYTNYTYAVYPGICEPTFALLTNYSTNIFTQYQSINSLNVVTNHYYTNTPIFSFCHEYLFHTGRLAGSVGNQHRKYYLLYQSARVVIFTSSRTN